MKIRSVSRLSDCNFRQHWILDGAYYMAEKRNFVPGMELDDWLQAKNVFVKMLITRYLNQAHEDGGLAIKGLQRLAKSLGVENSDQLMQEDALVHAIQQASKNVACFNFAPDSRCTISESCLWIAECKQMIAKWQS